jgi:hypothetical protein
MAAPGGIEGSAGSRVQVIPGGFRRRSTCVISTKTMVNGSGSSFVRVRVLGEEAPHKGRETVEKHPHQRPIIQDCPVEAITKAQLVMARFKAAWYCIVAGLCYKLTRMGPGTRVCSIIRNERQRISGKYHTG